MSGLAETHAVLEWLLLNGHCEGGHFVVLLLLSDRATIRMMGLQVYLEVSLLSEDLLADLALEGFHAEVFAQVDL